MEREIGLEYWAERNFNTVSDTSIHRMLPMLKAKLEVLMQVKTVASLHNNAFSAHQASFNQMMSKRDNIQLFWHLALCANSQPPSRKLARTQLNRIVRARQLDD